MDKLKEIGIFCGTFNPVHNAHLLLAQCASEQFALSKVYFVTSPRPPHRNDMGVSGEQRHEMVSKAVYENEIFVASQAELERPGPSYTFETIKYFKENLPNKNINLILGADNIIHLPSWYEFEQIIANCRLLIAPRRLITASTAKNIQSDIFNAQELAVLSKTSYALIDFPLMDISSSSIRQRIKESKSIRYMVPDAVCKYIMENSLYR